MKKVLGLDLGTTSLGWAFVHEAENDAEQSDIVRLGVRITQLDNFDKVDKTGKVTESKNPIEDFASGKGLSPNAGRTKKRGARRNLQRYKLRRYSLVETLKKAKIISEDTPLTEVGENTTYQTLALRAKAAKQRIEKDELARVLLAINKKRGYKSSRKAKNDEEGQVVDGMSVALKLYDEDLTPGQYCYRLLKEGKKVLPDFYRSDLKNEFDKIWDFQKQFYPNILTETLYKELEGKNKGATWKICEKPFNIIGVKREGSKSEQKIENFRWRSEALGNEADLEKLVEVFQEINSTIYNSSGYLGDISDRSKVLHFGKITVGEYLYGQILDNRHTQLKKQVFYRQDYLDEFEQIWENQCKFHAELTPTLKSKIRDIVIFYQRRLRSQKGLISFCEFESETVDITVDGKPKKKTIGARVCPKSSPLFQEFKIWQNLANLEIQNKKTKETIRFLDYELEEKLILFDELNVKGNLKKTAILKLLGLKPNEWDLNYTELQGNTTNLALFNAFEKILKHSGHEVSLGTLNGKELIEAVHGVFETLGINTDILYFNAEVDDKNFNKQKSYQLWHLLYSYEGDNSKTGNDALYKSLKKNFNIEKEYAQYLVNVVFQDDYGNLSTKAIRKIFPFIKEHVFSEACEHAGYNHSHSVTKEENKTRILKDELEPLPKNSLRNPVVEKILNQLVNVVNAIISDPELGKPDEIRVELARELKKSAKERQAATTAINNAKTKHEEFRKILQKDFFIPNPTRNDIIRYKLYKELAFNGYHTLYSHTYIAPNKLFSKEFDIEHIIPKARLFDDSFSNKTLETRNVNLEKGDETALDYMSNKSGDKELQEYVDRVEEFYTKGKDAFGKNISKAKYKKLLMKGSEIGEGFIERDLRESQYIAKKARHMLMEICRTVVPTTGSITDRLREDWGLIDTMKELNLPKYRSLGLTVFEERKDGARVEKITDWTKRNDHRHHAMDALTVAFTKHNHIQYLNNLNAKDDKYGKKNAVINAIELKETTRNDNGKRLFKLPLPNFRFEAKKHLEKVLISQKAKNKVVTNNKNKVNGSTKVQTTSTPRGQLHKETVYGSSKSYVTKMVKIGSAFDENLINQVANLRYREALLKRLHENGNNPKKAFAGANSPAKKTIYAANNLPLPEKVKLVWLENVYTIRKDVSPDNLKNEKSIEKVVDVGIKKILYKRLRDFDNDPKKAFVNLDINPIWVNKEKGIALKRVTMSGVNNAEPLHHKKNHLGEDILTTEGKRIPVDFVSTGNNHHVAIYRDEKGKLQEEVVSFYEAVARANADMPIITTTHEKGWSFQFTMKQNEMFVFPADNFKPEDIDLLNPEKYHLISPHLFRVQKFATKDYWFRHHLETIIDDRKELKNYSFKRITNLDNLLGIVKVRINHIGQIVQVGEY